MVFELLNPKLQKIIAKRFDQPTLPQKLAIPPILDDKNVLVIAQTGTGKTEAAMLGIFDKIMKQKLKPINILYVTPLKSLNRDLLDRLIWWSNEIDIETSVRHGDTSAYERKLQMEFPPQMLIITLETLQPILTGKKIREHLKNIKYVIIDEVHEIADSKRGVQLTLGLERLRELCEDFQLVMLSATIGEPEKIANFFSGGRPVEIVKAVTSKLIEINVINPESIAEDKKNAEKLFCSVDVAARVRIICDLIKQHRSVLTFTNTRDFAEILGSRIKTLDKNFPVEVHHSSLSKDVRIKTEKDFKNEKIKSILCTSSLQLGIDIGSVDLVLQYMSPRTISQMIQRVGRSGHELERISQSVVISTDEDDIFEAAVIARKALAEELEPIRFHEKSLDVLAHQIVGLTMDSWKINLKKAYEIVRCAHPYRNLSYEEFLEVCKQLQQLGLVFLNGEIKKNRRGFKYYFNNLSTIPSLKQFKIFNILDNSFVGVLDEQFVALHGEVGTTFIVKGEAWRIVSVEEDKVLVEPTVDIEAAIPGWEGELIPVPFEVAQEVGKLRAMLKCSVKNKSVKEIVTELQKMYPIDNNSARRIIKLIKKQVKYGIVPDEKNILVESHENTIILHTCFGTLVNETLGRFIIALLSLRLGSIGMRIDPYRIMLQFQTKIDSELVKEILFNTPPEHFRNYLELSLTKSNLFKWKFVHVAKRFGAISRDAEYGKVRMERVIEDYVNSPIYKETLKELKTEKLDIERAEEILKKIQSGEIKIIFKTGLSSIGKIGLKHQYAEVIGPERPELEIFELFKQRILNTKIRLVCINCGKWDQSFIVKEVPKDVKCGKCDARLLGVVHPKNQQILKIIKKKSRTTEEMKMFERVKKTAELFIVYKKNAVLALAGRGVGPQTATRILAKFHKDEDDLIRDVLEAERNYIKTKKYWRI